MPSSGNPAERVSTQVLALFDVWALPRGGWGKVRQGRFGCGVVEPVERIYANPSFWA